MNTIVLSQELDDAVYNCRKALQKANEALSELHHLADYPTPSTLKDVTSGNLCAFVEQRIKAVMATPIYTAAQRDKAVNDWQEWRIKTMPLVVAVENFYNDWQEVQPVLDTADMSILTSDITEALRPRFTVEIPIQAHRHQELINSVANAIKDLRAWEREQDIKKIPLKELLSLATNDLFQSWASGSIKVDHTLDDARLIAWRKANNEAIL